MTNKRWARDYGWMTVAFMTGNLAMAFVDSILSDLIFWATFSGIILFMMRKIMKGAYVPENTISYSEKNFNLTGVTDAPINFMYCPITIKGRKIWCLIDTGCTGFLNLKTDVVLSLGLEETGNGTVTTASHSNIPSKRYKGAVTIGRTTFKEMDIVAYDFQNKDNEHIKGIIGIQLIAQGKFSIEQKDKQFHYNFEI